MKCLYDNNTFAIAFGYNWNLFTDLVTFSDTLTVWGLNFSCFRNTCHFIMTRPGVHNKNSWYTRKIAKSLSVTLQTLRISCKPYQMLLTRKVYINIYERESHSETISRSEAYLRSNWGKDFHWMGKIKQREINSSLVLESCFLCPFLCSSLRCSAVKVIVAWGCYRHPQSLATTWVCWRWWLKLNHATWRVFKLK